MTVFRTRLRVKEWKREWLLARLRELTPEPSPWKFNKRPYPYQKPPEPPRCPKCRIRLDSNAAFVCAVPQCPTGMGGAWSGISSVGS